LSLQSLVETCFDFLESFNPNAQGKLYYHRIEDFFNVMFPVEKNMDSLICYAPVWNSTEWVTSDMKMEIRGTGSK
jgi:hypothetical protein